MAKVTKTDPVVETVVVQEGRVDLSLSLEEAEVLAVVLANIGGSPLGPRGITEGVLESLIGAGIEWDGSKFEDLTAGYITFTDPVED